MVFVSVEDLFECVLVRRSWRQSAEAVMSRNYLLWNMYRVLESRVHCIGLQLVEYVQSAGEPSALHRVATCFHRANWHSPATLRVFRDFSSVIR